MTDDTDMDREMEELFRPKMSNIYLVNKSGKESKCIKGILMSHFGLVAEQADDVIETALREEEAFVARFEAEIAETLVVKGETTRQSLIPQNTDYVNVHLEQRAGAAFIM